MDPASMKPHLRERQGMTTLTRVNSYTPLSHILAYITKLTYIETVVLVNFSLIPKKVFLKFDLLNLGKRKGSVTLLALFADILVLFF